MIIKIGDVVFEDGVKLKVSSLYTNNIGRTIVSYVGEDAAGACLDTEWLKKYEID